MGPELGQPRRHSARTGVARYDLAYELVGEPGDLLVQEVRTEIVCAAGGEPLVAYRAVYGEWFRLGSGAPIVDRHHLVIRRDGWARESIEALLRRHSPKRGLPRRPGQLALTCIKRFVLGRGEVVDELPARRLDGAGAAFGFLRSGPREVAGGQLEVFVGDGVVEPLRSPYPGGVPGAGVGSFVGRRGWQATEVFRWTEGGERATLDGGQGYEAVELSSTSTSATPTSST